MNLDADATGATIALARIPQVHIMREIYRLDPDTQDVLAMEFVDQHTATPEGFVSRQDTIDKILDGTIKNAFLRAT